MDAFFLSVIDKPSVISVIVLFIYITYNEIKKHLTKKDLLIDSKQELIAAQAVAKYKTDTDNRENAYNEIRRYVINKFKHYKINLTKQLDFNVTCINSEHDNCARINTTSCLESAASGILYSALLKVEDDLMVHIIQNGYSNLSISGLEDYIHYTSETIHDRLTNILESTEHIIKLKKHITINDIKIILRDIFETAINIKTRRGVDIHM